MSLIDNWNVAAEAHKHEHDIDGMPKSSVQSSDRLYGAMSDDEDHDAREAPGAAEQERAPVFELAKLDYPYRREFGAFKRVAVAANTLIVATENSYIIRLDLGGQQAWKEVEISRRPEDSVYEVFLDPTGAHILISFGHGETHYLHSSATKARPLSKLKGLMVSAVAWCAKEVLVGTSEGKIYELVFEGLKDKSLTELYDINTVGSPDPGVAMGISGMYCEQVSPSVYFAMVATTTRYYQFLGGSTLAGLFAPGTQLNIVDLPGEIGYSELHFFRKTSEAIRSFVWMAGPGVCYGDFNFDIREDDKKGDTPMLMLEGGKDILQNRSILPYPDTKDPAAEFSGVQRSLSEREGEPAQHPIAVNLSEFHIFLLYTDHLNVINKLSKETVFIKNFAASRQVGKLRGLVRDPTKDTIWIYSDSTILEVIVDGEDRDMWRLYLADRSYRTALEFCRSTSQRDKVLTEQADHCFEGGHYEQAAEIYAQTNKSFEEVTLKFTIKAQIAALKVFLTNKLEALRPSAKPQRTALCTWLTEIMLQQLCKATRITLIGMPEVELDPSGQDGADPAAATASEQALPLVEQEDRPEEEWDRLIEFRKFLERFREDLEPETIFTIIASHGRMEELLFFATLLGDHVRVIRYHTSRKDWQAALVCLCQQDDPELVYEYSPQLMRYEPVLAVDAWLQFKELDPRRLIPALMRYDVKHNPPPHTENQAIRYLQHVVTELGNHDLVIHNYLLSLYADLQGHEKILSFLAQEPRHYDLRYALRTCMRAGKQKACIHIYNYMGKYEEAVELSLEIGDLALAKANADAAASLPEPPGKEEDYYGAHELEAAGFGAPFGQEPNQERRKKLWLRIAQHVFAETQDPSLTAAASRRTVAGNPVGESSGGGGEEDDEGEGAGEAERHRIVAGEDGKPAPEESQGVQGVEGGTEAVPAPGGGGEGPEEAGPGDDEGGEEGISVARLQRNIREAVQFVRQCEMIKIEDILPFFPEGTRLDDFQEEICVSLEDYNRDIEVLKSTMDEATRSAENIQNDIRELRNRFGFIAADQLCDLCGQPVLIRQFYLYPCQHVFHEDCLQNEMRKHLEPNDVLQVDVLQKAITELKRKPRNSGVHENILRVKQRQHMKAELDALISSQCIYCGDIMIKAVENLFISPTEGEQIESWQI